MRWSSLAPALALAALMHSSAAAQPTPETTVSFFGDEERHAGFVSALRIQLAGVATVAIAEPLPDGDPLSRKPRALAETRRIGATIALWFQSSDGTLVLYAVEAAGSGRPLEIGRTDEPGTSFDRELALKVSAMVDSMLVRSSTVTAPDIRIRTPARTETTPAPSATSGATWAMVLITGGGAAVDAGSPIVRGGPALSIGFGRAAANIVVDGTAGVRWFAPRSVRSPTDSGELSEWSANGRVDVAFRISRLLSLGPSAEVGIRWASASVETGDGVAGDSRRATPYVAAGCLMRVALAQRLHADATVFGTASLVREHFTVRGMQLAENGWVRVGGRLSLRLSLP